MNQATQFMYMLGYVGVPVMFTLLAVSIVRRMIVKRVAAKNEKKRAEAIALEMQSYAPDALREITRANVLKSEYAPEILTEKLQILEDEEDCQ